MHRDDSLPSSELLKHLLSEPIRSWRSFTDPPEDTMKQSKADIISFSSDSLELLGTSQKRLDGEDVDATSAVSLVSGCNSDARTPGSGGIQKLMGFEMLPGLTSKPPLPRKNENNNANKTDLEKISNEERTESASDSTDFSLKDAIMKDSDLINLMCQSSTVAKNKEPMFQNWIIEEEEIENEVALSERQTDMFLDSLKTSNESSKPKPKKSARFTATPIRTPKDIIQEHQEVESWVSTESSKANDVDSWVNESVAPQSKVNYTDVLENLDDVEENDESVGRQSSSSGIVEDNGTYEEIVSILRVLEDEDKKSRECCGGYILRIMKLAPLDKQMEVIKEMVKTEINRSMSASEDQEKPLDRDEGTRSRSSTNYK